MISGGVESFVCAADLEFCIWNCYGFWGGFGLNRHVVQCDFLLMCIAFTKGRGNWSRPGASCLSAAVTREVEGLRKRLELVRCFMHRLECEGREESL
jgi:hypothetical protein